MGLQHMIESISTLKKVNEYMKLLKENDCLDEIEIEQNNYD